jgi:hypothetical protein
MKNCIFHILKNSILKIRKAIFLLILLPFGWIKGEISLALLLDCEEQFLRYTRFGRYTSLKEKVCPETIYIFIFLGEFGFELLNWQGVVRKFAQQLFTSNEIIIAGRKGLQPFYEYAYHYIDISSLPLFQNSVANCYFAIPPQEYALNKFGYLRTLGFNSELAYLRQAIFDFELRTYLCTYISEKIAMPSTSRHLKFIFSSQVNLYEGCVFGPKSRDYWKNIYRSLNIENNVYTLINADLQAKYQIEEELGFNLEHPYVLVQLRKRVIGPQVGGILPERQLIEELARHIPVVVLLFDTGRFLDSVSATRQEGERIFSYRARSFRDQSCLIAYARKCVFLTEGDLGSHTYLPPFLGKDVTIIASRKIFELPSAPIVFWNKHIFRFGGKMIPLVAESIFESSKSLCRAVDELLD